MVAEAALILNIAIVRVTRRNLETSRPRPERAGKYFLLIESAVKKKLSNPAAVWHPYLFSAMGTAQTAASNTTKSIAGL